MNASDLEARSGERRVKLCFHLLKKHVNLVKRVSFATRNTVPFFWPLLPFALGTFTNSSKMTGSSICFHDVFPWLNGNRSLLEIVYHFFQLKQIEVSTSVRRCLYVSLVHFAKGC